MHPAVLEESLLRQLQANEGGVVFFPSKSSRVVLYTARARKAEEMLALVPARGLWACDSGARLVGYDWPPQVTAGTAITVPTFWTFQDAPSQERRARHSAFAGLVTLDGRDVAQSAAWGLPERYWQNGLLLVQWVPLSLPPGLGVGEYRLVAGMVRKSDNARNRWLDDQGRDAGDYALLGTVSLSR
jgi:hypothetical protein